MADNLFTSERFDMISDYLKEHGRATVDELAKVLYVSQATVRRDLNEMQKLGIIQRTHGGAVFVDNVDEVNIFVRIEKNTADKQKAVEIALDRLPSFNTVFIDNSSTCLALAERMNFQYKTIITNGLQLAVKLSNRKDVKVIFLGGVIQYSSYSTDGSLTTEMLDRFHMDLMLSSCAAIREDGTYEPTPSGKTTTHSVDMVQSVWEKLFSSSGWTYVMARMLVGWVCMMTLFSGSFFSLAM